MNRLLRIPFYMVAMLLCGILLSSLAAADEISPETPLLPRVNVPIEADTGGQHTCAIKPMEVAFVGGRLITDVQMCLTSPLSTSARAMHILAA